MITRVLLLTGAVLVFGVVNFQIASKERLRAAGETVYLDLAPIDPRSVMQGDYMALNFALARQIGGAIDSENARSGVAVIRMDERRVARFARLDTGAPLQPGEARFRYRIRSGAVWLGTNAFFFEEGSADKYSGARFGEFRVNGAGEAMLVGLRDAALRELNAPR